MQLPPSCSTASAPSTRTRSDPPSARRRRPDRPTVERRTSRSPSHPRPHAGNVRDPAVEVRWKRRSTRLPAGSHRARPCWWTNHRPGGTSNAPIHRRSTGRRPSARAAPAGRGPPAGPSGASDRHPRRRRSRRRRWFATPAVLPPHAGSSKRPDMLTAEAAALVATALALVGALPQLRRLAVTGDTNGVSLTNATLGVGSELGWVAYTLQGSLWSAIPEAALMAVTNLLLARALMRAGDLVRPSRSRWRPSGGRRSSSPRCSAGGRSSARCCRSPTACRSCRRSGRPTGPGRRAASPSPPG